MPIIRTKFRPWEDQEVTAEEAASMERMGLLSNIQLGEPTIVADPESETPAEPDPAPAVDAPAPSATRRAKSTSAAPAEEVNTDGSSEEGSGQETVPEEG